METILKILEKLFNIKKMPTRFVCVICVCSALILFLPKPFLAKFWLNDFFEEYGKYAGIVFIVSFVFLLIVMIYLIIRTIYKNILRKRMEEGIRKAIQHLNYHEKALLREFFIHGKTTMHIPMDDDTVVGLVNKHVIYQSSNVVSVYSYRTYLIYSITETAQENLTCDMVGLPQNPAEADREWIANHRPQWAKDRSKDDYLLNSY
jgi:uncharacterized membrane protein